MRLRSEVRADDEAELILRVQRHALDAHATACTPEEVLQLAFPAELDEPSWTSRAGSRGSQAEPLRTYRNHLRKRGGMCLCSSDCREFL